MKKMYLALFLIVLVVFVFAGCLNFSGALDSNPTTDYYEGADNQYETLPDSAVNNGTVIPEQTTGAVIPEQTTAMSGTEATTSVQTPGTAEATTSSSTVTNPPVSAPTGNTEYDILKSGIFHMTGSMTDSTGMDAPMEIAVTPSSIYMLSDFSGATMGMLISDDKVFMIYPDKSAYLELSDSIMSMAGLDVDELVNSESINFSTYGDLSQAASVTNEVANGRNCTVYHFNVEDGSETRVYMEGNKLVRLASYSASGKFQTATDISTISGTVPADKSAPPKSFKAYKGMTGMISFMTLLEGVIE